MKSGEHLLRDALLSAASITLLGEAVGVHGLTAGYTGKNLIQTPLSEEGAVGLAVGLGLAGAQPVVELLDPTGLSRAAGVLAEAAALGKTSEGQWQAPVVVLAPANSALPALAEGVQLVAAATPAELPGMVAHALAARAPVVVLLAEAALQEKGEAAPVAPLHQAVIRRAAPQDRRAITVLTWGDGVARALAAAAQEPAIEVVDLRCLSTLDRATVGESARRTGRVLLLGDVPALLSAAVQEAFLYLESPPQVLALSSTPEAVVNAVRTSLDW